MPPRTDILDQPERLRGAFWGSVSLHVGVVAVVLSVTWAQAHRSRIQLGSLNGGGFGSVAVNPVARIPLPTQGGAVNPVANDTESRAPTPPPKAKAQPKTRAPEPGAVPIPSRNAQRSPSAAESAPNRFRDQQKDVPNQVFSESGQRLNSPNIGMAGGGGDRIGINTPFGDAFGGYADIIKNRVGQAWRTAGIDQRIRAGQVVITFTINRDGTVPGPSVQIRVRSGNMALDLSAQRAILDSSPFPALPAQWPRNSADIEFTFELRR